MFVEVGPLDGVALAKKSPVLLFFASGPREAWIPFQRHDKSPAIDEIDDQFLAADGDLQSFRLILKSQSSHAKSRKNRFTFKHGSSNTVEFILPESHFNLGLWRTLTL